MEATVLNLGSQWQSRTRREYKPNVGPILSTSELRFIADRVDDHLRSWVLWDTLSTVDKDPTESDRDSGTANPNPLRATQGQRQQLWGEQSEQMGYREIKSRTVHSRFF